MKWVAAAAGVAVAGGLALLLIGPGKQPAPQPAPAPVAVTAPPALPAPHVAAAVVPPRAPPPTGITLHGTLLRGTHSQALLTVDGQPQQAYGIGDAVKPGWSVQAIREQDVVLANGSATAVLAVAAPPAGAPAAPAPVVSTSASTRLPGFVSGAPTPLDDAAASARNRRFLDALQARKRTPP